MIKTFIQICLLISFLVPAVPARAQSSSSGFRLSPTIQEIYLAPGETTKANIQLSYPVEDSSVQMRVDFKDFTPGEEGTPNISQEKDSEYGASQFISGQDKITIPASSEITYEATITIPNYTKERTYYGLVQFTSAPTATGEGSQQLSSAIASLLLVHVGAPQYEATVNSVSAKAFDVENGLVRIEVDIQNRGQFAFKPTVAVTIKDSKDAVLAALEYDGSGNVLPQSYRVFTLEYDGTINPQETYTATATVAIPNGDVIITEPVVVYEAPAQNIEPLDDTRMPIEAKEDKKTNYSIYIIIGVVGFVALLSAIGIAVWVLTKKQHSMFVSNNDENIITQQQISNTSLNQNLSTDELGHNDQNNND